MPAKPVRESKRSSTDTGGALLIFTELGYFALAEDPFPLTEQPNKSVSITLSFPQLDMYIAPLQRNSFMGFVCGSSEDIAFST